MGTVTTSNPVLLTQEELEERGTYWQRRLRLQDWRITFKVVNREQMDHPNCSGRVNFTLRLLVADVLIIRPEDYPPYPDKS